MKTILRRWIAWRIATLEAQESKLLQYREGLDPAVWPDEYDYVTEKLAYLDDRIFDYYVKDDEL